MTTKTIRFMKHYVTDGTTKARVLYSHGWLTDGSRPVTLYARDYGHELGAVFHGIDGVGYQTDYFDKGCVRIAAGHPLYAAAVTRCQKNDADRDAKYARRTGPGAAAGVRQ